MTELLSNDYFLICGMSVVICLCTQLVKLPFKLATNKIKNAKVESRVTALFMLLPLALGVLFNYLYNGYYLHIDYSIIEGLSWGTTSIMFYQAFKKVVTGKEPTAEEKAQVESVKTLVETITEDGKVDKSDSDAIKDFLNKVK